jgi:tRNA-modifying protein YgfZ
MPDPNTFQQIAEHAGLFDRSDQIRLVIKGPDRAKFLHNLLTNEIKRLAIGKGCEAFVTSTQGKTLAFVTVLAGVDVILLRSDAGAIAGLLPHLTKYGVFDDVVIEDQSASTFEYHVAGPAAAEIVRHACGELPPEIDLAHVTTDVGGEPVRLIRESPTILSGLTLIGDIAIARTVRELLLPAGREPSVRLKPDLRSGEPSVMLKPALGSGDLGLIEAGPEIFDALRIEAGTPIFGKDITEKNLPQEIGRDDRAISFVKGCYLGQETVARIDALGHVNQVMRGLIFESGSPVPEPGSGLEENGKRVGAVSSAAFSPVRNAPVALAFIRTSHTAPGTVVQVRVSDGAATLAAIVSDFPLKCPKADH